MKKSEARKRVRRGAARLDEVFGRKWRRWIRLRRLDLGTGLFDPAAKKGSLYGCGCVLAQIDAHGARGGAVGSYTVGLNAVDVDPSDSDRFGFDAHDPDDYTLLTAVWRDEIRAGR